jgi:hypothetical protein
MGDPFEGHYTATNAKDEDAFVSAQMSAPDFGKMTEAQHRENFRLILQGSMAQKKLLFVNCWHMNEGESLAMWKLYAAHNDSICIQSTCAKLVRLLPKDAFVGMVRYIDYNSHHIDWGMVLEYIVHKRLSFAHERELRAVIWTPSASGTYEAIGDSGLVVPVKMNELIDAIFVNPEADQILIDVLNGLKTSFSLKAPITKSDVNAGPTY